MLGVRARKEQERREDRERVKGGTSGLGKGKIGKKGITKERQLGDVQIGLRNGTGVADGREWICYPA